MQSRFSSGRAVFAAIVVIYLGFAAATIVTKRPWVDEAWFTGPGLDLVTRGKFGTLLLDPAGSHLRLFKPDTVLQGINERTYWVMPLHLVQIALWGKLFGFSVFSIRVPSALWGILALASVGVVIRRLYPPGGNAAALIGAAVLAVDFGFVESASEGRMDMMCSALGFASLAAYLTLRERNFHRAVLLSSVLAAAACFTHPNGAYASVALVVAMAWLDRRAVRPLTIAIMAAPYAVGGLAWAAYCAQAPSDFVAQFSANSASKLEGLFTPWRGIWLEIHDRYAAHYWPEGMSGKLKVIGLLLCLAAMWTLVANRALRLATGCRLLVCLVVLRFLILAVSGGPKFEFYMVHILPYFAAMIGIAAWHFWSSQDLRMRILCVAALTIYFGVQTSVLLHKVVSIRGYQNEYRPMVNYLESSMRPDDLVAGSSELGFALGFYNRQVVDDVWLGYWSRKQPSVVVVDQWYYEPAISSATQKGLPLPDYFTTLLSSQFNMVKEMKGYRIYRRRAQQ
jgi:hypothetical protein